MGPSRARRHRGLLRSDRQLPGFQGSIAIGVRTGGVALWWVAQFTPSTSAHGIVAKRTEGADVEVFLSESEALAFFGGHTGIDTDHVVGDRGLLRKFLHRYLKVRKQLDIRLQH